MTKEGNLNILETEKTKIVSVMLEEKKNLLNSIADIFLAKGFYKTTMDEIASDLRVSKKTIYKFFPTKEVLLNLVIHGMVFSARKQFRKIVDQDKPAIDKLVMVTDFFLSLFSKINYSIVTDIQKLGPQFWNKVERLREREIYNNFGKLIEQGKKEGSIKPIPKELILRVYISVIQSVMNPDFIVKNEFSIQHAGKMTMDIIFNGVMTDEGKIIYEKLKMEQQ